MSRKRDQSLVNADDAPMSADDGRTNADDAPTSADDTPTSADDAPTSADDAPMSADDAPASADDVPTSADDAPTNSVNFPTEISVPMSDDDDGDDDDDGGDDDDDEGGTGDAREDPDYKPSILMYESLKVRGVSEARAKQQPLLYAPVNCRPCRRVTGDPHVMCIRHIIHNSLPVCTRKSRCDACAKMDGNYWIRYMKSYYGSCHNLSDEEFEAHLEIQRQHGIPIDHRTRKDGRAVFLTRQQAGVTDGVSQRSGGGRISVSRRAGDVTESVSRQSDGDTDHKPIGYSDIVLM